MINVTAPAAAPAPSAANIQTGSASPMAINESKPAAQSPIGIDYSLFSNTGMGGAGDGTGEGGVGGNAADAAAAAAAGTGDGFSHGGHIQGMRDGGPVYKSIPSIDYQNRKMAEHLAKQGRGRDTTLVHMSRPEVMGLGSLHPSGRMPINPKTGLPEADFLSDVLPGLAGTLVGTAVGMPWLGAAVGGLGTWAATGNLGKGILSGLLSFGLGELGSQLGAAGTEATAAGAAKDLSKTAATTGSITGITPQTAEQAKFLEANVPAGLTSAPLPASVAPSGGAIERGLQNLSNIPTQISNIGTGLVNPQNWNLSKMLVPAAITGGALYGMNQMGQQAAAPIPQMPQQAPPPPLTTGAVPPRLPTGATPPPGYGTSEYPRETSFFQPNPAWGGYPSYAAEGGPVTAYATGGGVMHDGATYQLAKGGLSNLPSGLIRGPGGGMDDKIKGSIDGRRDVYLSDGEYVVDAQTVSALGDGSSEAGAKRMKQLVENIRQKKFGSKKQPAKMASMGGLASIPFDAERLEGGSNGEPVKGGTYRGPGFFEKYFGIGAEKPQDPERSWTNTPIITNMPSREDVESERKYGTSGPNPGDRIPSYDMEKLIDLVNSGRISGSDAYKIFREEWPKAKAIPDSLGLSNEDAYRLYAGQMLAMAAPTSYLGYNEHNITYSPSRKKRSNISGMTIPNNQIYVDLNDPSVVAHESIHAGINSLPKDSDIRKRLKEDSDLNELVTRAIMLRRFGDIEENESGVKDPQVTQARNMLKNKPEFLKFIQSLEKESAHEGARRLIEKQGSIR